MQKTAIWFGNAAPAIFEAEQSVLTKQLKGQLLRTFTKTLLVMKLTLLLFIAFCCQVQAAVFSQAVTLSGKDMPLTRVFAAIEKQTGYVVFGNLDMLSKTKLVSIEVKNKELKEVLEDVLKHQPIEFLIKGKTIVLSEKKTPATPFAELPGDRLFGAAPITGKVVDSLGNPIQGASVRLTPGNKGASTKADGGFSIAAVNTGNYTLEVSFIGYKKIIRSITVGEDPVILHLIMSVELIQEDEVIVTTGYQNIRKPEMVGSVSTIKREDLFYDGTSSLEQMLQGKLPGTLVMNTSGMVGTRQKVRVRGTSTLLGNQEPVWVVDGIIQEDPIPFKAQELDTYGNITEDNFDMIKNFIGNSIAWLNPNDIEDITVLKDASATVLYGVKAANGVIVINTKRGKAGSISVNYSGGATMSKRLTYDKMNLMNSKERIDVSREIYETRLIGPRYNDKVGYEYALRRYLDKELTYAEFDAEVKRLEIANTDWFDILFRNPVSQHHTVNISGGAESIRYYGSLGINKVLGSAKGNESETNTSSINLDAKINKKVAVSLRVNGSLSKTKGFYKIDPYTYATNTSRAIPAFQDNGAPLFYDHANKFKYNVLNELANTGNINDSRTLNTHLTLRYDILKGLRFESILGAASTTAKGESYASEYSNYITADFRRYEYGTYVPGDVEYKASVLPHGGELNTTESRTTSITWRNSLAYNHLVKDHRLSFLLGQESRSTKSDGESSTVFGYFPDRGKNITFPPPMITLSNGTLVGNSLYQGYFGSRMIDRTSNFLSFYGNTTYSYDERYVATGSIRFDASNRFGQNTQHRFLPVWSAGVRWNAHNEAWLKNVNLISELNFRATYGWQGNVAENFGPDLIAQIPYNPIDSYTGEFALLIKSLPYADLRWEKTGTVNLGMDLGILKNRFIFSFEYYYKNSKDVIIYKEIPVEYGVATMPVNAGDLMNKGIELQMSGTIVRTKDWVWSMSLNSSKNLNRVQTEFPTATWWMGAVAGNLIKKGYPVSSFWAFNYKGPNPQNGFPEYEIPTAEENVKAMTDVTEYMQYMGKMEPDFSGGFSTVLRYKTFTMSTSFNVNIGGKKFLYKMFAGSLASSIPSAYENLPQEFVKRWRKPGDEKVTSIPAIPTLTNNGNQNVIYYPSGYVGYIWDMYNYSNDRVVDASFLRCNNISLSYNLQENILQALRVKNLAFTFSVSNPFIIVSKDFKGMDPEVATGQQPITKNWSFGINASF